MQIGSTSDGVRQIPFLNTPFLSYLTVNIEATGNKAPGLALVGFVAAWILFFLFLWVIPLPDVRNLDGSVTKLTPAGRACLAVMVWACVIWLTEAVPIAMTGLIIPALLVLTNAAKNLAGAASAFSSPVALLCLAAFIFAALMMASGLDRRIAIGLMNRVKLKEAGGVIWSMFGFNLVLSLILPAANARAATMLPIINGILSLFGDSAAERNAKKAIVIQSIVYGAMISGICILTAHVPNLIVVGLLDTQLQMKISYFQWFLLQWPYIGMFFITQWWVRYYFRTAGVEVPGGIETIRGMQKELPPMTRQDYFILGVFGVVALLWMTESWHKISSAVSILIGVALMFAPGFMSFKWKTIEDRTIWGTWVMLGGALSISTVMTSSGLANWLAAFIHPLVHGYPWWTMLLLVLVGTHVIRLGILSNIAAITVLAPILVALAPKLGLHPAAFTMLVANCDTFAYLLPTQLTAAVIAYGTGTFTMTDYFRVGWVSVAIAIVYSIVIVAPWYAFLGIPLWNPAAPWPF